MKIVEELSHIIDWSRIIEELYAQYISVYLNFEFINAKARGTEANLICSFTIRINWVCFLTLSNGNEIVTSYC